MPRILFLPTASGDPRDQIGRFHARLRRPAVRAGGALALPHGRPAPPAARGHPLPGRHLRRRRLDAQPAGHLAGPRPGPRCCATRGSAGSSSPGSARGRCAGCGRRDDLARARPSRRRAWACCPGSLSVHADTEPGRRAVYLRRGGRRRPCRRGGSPTTASACSSATCSSSASSRRGRGREPRASTSSTGPCVETPIEPELIAPRAARRPGRRARAARRRATATAARLTVEGGHQRARAAAVAVLAQVDPLPRARGPGARARPAGERRPEQRGLDVGRHVVGPFERVRPAARSPRARPRRTTSRSRGARRARRSR